MTLLPIARVVRCDLVIHEPPPKPPRIQVGELVLLGVPIVCVLLALLIPALHR